MAAHEIQDFVTAAHILRDRILRVIIILNILSLHITSVVWFGTGALQILETPEDCELSVVLYVRSGSLVTHIYNT